MELCEKAAALLKELEFQAAEIPMGELSWLPESRDYCAANKCRSYGSCWACPPAVGTLEECKARCAQYAHFLLFARMYELEDSLDIEGMGDAHDDFQERVDRLGDALREAGISDFLILNNEGCSRCDEDCTYPDAPCRFPDQLSYSMEGFGLFVSQVCKDNGLEYNHGPNTMTYSACFFLE